MTTNRFKSKKAGSSLSLTMMFFTVIGMVTLTAVGVSTTNDAMAQRAVEKTQANALAESGVEMLYDRICRDYAGLKSATQTLAEPTITTTFAGRDRVQGGYAARVVDVQTQKTSPAPGYSSGSVQYIHTYQIEGTGTAKNGTISITRATFKVKRILNGEEGGSGSQAVFAEFPGAINSNTTIELITNQGIRTQDPAGSNKAAHIVANTGILWKPYSNSKETYVNPNIIDIQGQILVPNQPNTSVVDFTRGISGLGNPNGKKNYQSAASSTATGGTYDATGNDVTGMGQSKVYPGYTELVALKSSLLSQAKNAPNSATYGGNLSSGSVAFHPSLGRKIVYAPAVIDGDLIVNSGDHIHLVPRSTNVENNVVYVKGNIKNLGELANMGVKLVTLGQYTDASSSVYQIATQNSPYSSLSDIYKNAGFISLNQRKDAVKIISNSTARYGNFFAAAGGIEITGNLEVNGILTSGGPAEYSKQQIWEDPSRTLTGSSPAYGGGVLIRPNNGNSFVVNYVREAKEFKIGGGNASNVPLSLLEPIRADRLTDWRRLK